MQSKTTQPSPMTTIITNRAESTLLWQSCKKSWIPIFYRWLYYCVHPLGMLLKDLYLKSDILFYRFIPFLGDRERDKATSRIKLIPSRNEEDRILKTRLWSLLVCHRWVDTSWRSLLLCSLMSSFYILLLFYVSAFFLYINSYSLFSLASLSLPLSCISPHQMDQLLGSVIEMWVDRMDNITQPERRKLSSLALLSLLPSDNRWETFFIHLCADGALSWWEVGSIHPVSCQLT